MSVTFDYTVPNATIPREIEHDRQEKITFVLPHGFAAASVTDVVVRIRTAIDGGILFERVDSEDSTGIDDGTDNEVTVTLTSDDTRYIDAGTYWIGITVKSADDDETPLNVRYRLIGAASHEGGGQLIPTDVDRLTCAIVTEADIREAADDALALRVDDLETAVALQESLVAAIYNNDVLAHWPLTDASGETRFDSQSPYNGAWSGSPTTADGLRPTERNVSADGDDDVFDFYSASLSDDFNPDAFSVSFWFKPKGDFHDGSANQLFLLASSSTDSLGIAVLSNNLTVTYLKDGEDSVSHLISSSALSEAWYNITVTIGGDTISSYFNGALIDQTSALTGWSTGLNSLYCKLGGSFVANFETEMDVAHLAIFNEVITQDSVQTIANSVQSTSNVLVLFGDSITAGAGATTTPKQWASIVQAHLAFDSVQDSSISATILQNTVQNTVATIGGAASNNGRDRYESDIVAHSPTHVFILYGTNDIRLNDAEITSARFATDLGEIVDGVVASGVSPKNILIGSPPYLPDATYSIYAPYNGGNATKHQAYADECQNVCIAKGCTFVDVYSAMKTRGDDALIAGDGVHPNDLGHYVIAEMFLNAFAVRGTSL